MDLIDVPAGLNGVAVAETEIGTVLGDEGFYHYREYDAAELARTAGFEDAWFLLDRGRLPDVAEREAFRADVAARRHVPVGLASLLPTIASVGGSPLAGLRTALSASAGPLGLLPMLDLTADERRRQALDLVAAVPAVLGALHRLTDGVEPVEPDPALGHAASYLHQVTDRVPEPEHARALEQYLMLTIDHGFNASTFTGRAVASTGADIADVVCAAIGALAGPLHGVRRAVHSTHSARSARPNEPLTGSVARWPPGAASWGSGTVYRAPDPRSALLRRSPVDWVANWSSGRWRSRPRSSRRWPSSSPIGRCRAMSSSTRA
ncbi:MAG: citrate/2-methylcitrate synthase [Ilumatobacteraceae bacterium]